MICTEYRRRMTFHRRIPGGASEIDPRGLAVWHFSDPGRGAVPLRNCHTCSLRLGEQRVEKFACRCVLRLSFNISSVPAGYTGRRELSTDPFLYTKTNEKKQKVREKRLLLRLEF